MEKILNVCYEVLGDFFMSDINAFVDVFWIFVRGFFGVVKVVERC